MEPGTGSVAEDRIQEALEQASVPAPLVALLCDRIAAPPGDLFPPHELEDASPARVMLFGALVSALDMKTLGPALTALLAALAAREAELSTYDRGRYWHLRGYAAWRVADDVGVATTALGRSSALLQEAALPEARRYLARVCDTWGQLLHHRGLLADAEWEFECALALRREFDDLHGEALTRGNLGRLGLDAGKLETAQACFARDLEIVEAISPELTRLRGQLLCHLGEVSLELGEVPAAQQYFEQSRALAEADENPVGRGYAALGQGRALLRDGVVAAAAAAIEMAQACLEEAGFAEGLKGFFRGVLRQGQAELLLLRGDGAGALVAFQEAQTAFVGQSGISAVEFGRLLYGRAQAHMQIGEDQEAAAALRDALRTLDRSAATPLRSEIEEVLRTRYRESWLLHTAGRFVGHARIEARLSATGEAGFQGESREMTVLFSDIRSFTTLSEQFSPAGLIAFLNDYLSLMACCVQHFEGHVDKFIGDALMALFGMGTDGPLPVEAGLRAALLMQAEVERLNRRVGGDGTPLRIGIGVHYGDVVAGLIGSPQRRSYTVIGDAVNTASRLEGMTKQLGASVLVSQAVVDHLEAPERFLLRPLGRYCPKGRQQCVGVYDVMGLADGSLEAAARSAEINAVTDGLAAFQEGAFGEALSRFAELGDACAGDPRENGYRLLAACALEFLNLPPEPDWDGSIRLTEK